jgi:hypothetical protein
MTHELVTDELVTDELVTDELLCPSAPASVDALVIGVVGADGTVDYVRDALPVTRRFLRIVEAGGRPESRFRFASACQQCACRQWVDGECSLPRRLAEVVPAPDPAERIPRCAIRARCRWFHQSGAAACRTCPVVSTRDDAEANRDGPEDRSRSHE